jgi:hypothetical protein
MGKGIPLFVGLVLLTIGLSLFYYRVSKIKAGIVTNATVLRIDSKRDGEDMLHRPILRFINYKDEPMIYKPEYRATDWYTGETVKILYTKDHYDDISILSYFSTFGIALIFFSGALVALFIAAGEYWSRYFFKTLKKPVPIG